jgi:tetratricopeptide (TPR) repeat protein
MSPGFDPANADPEGGVPMADPNDRPPERPADNPTSAGNDAETPPEFKPPGLDIAPAERDRKVKKHVQKGTSALQNNADPDRAISEAKSALLVDETSIDAMVILAHGNVVKGYYDLAEDILLKAFARGGKSNKKAFFLLGLVYENTKRPEKAPIAYQNALTLDPNYKSALMNLGVNHLGSKRYQDAVKIYERLTSELGMDQASVWTNLGSAYRGHSNDFVNTDITMRNKLVLKAEESYKRAISRDKNYGNAYYNMGLLYLDADPYPVGNGEMDRVKRLKNAKTYFDEYRRLPKSDQKLVDETAAVAQKLIDREETLRKKKAERERKRKALEEKKRKRALEKKNQPDEFDSDEGFE